MFYISCVLLLILVFILYKKYKWFEIFLNSNSPFFAFLVSLVTFFLVLATWNLATSTKKMAESSKDQIGLLRSQSVSLDSQAVSLDSQAVSLDGQVEQLRRNVDLQEQSFDLEFRPYISIILVNFGVYRDIENINTFIGGDMLYRNYGKIPASNIETKFYITTKEDGPHNRSLEEYAQKEWGGYKKVSFLSPGEPDAVSRRLSLSPSTTIYYINAIVTYEGIVENRIYWTFFKKAIRIKNITEEHPIAIEIDSEGYWDKDKDFTPPELKPPDFSIYEQPKKD